MGQYKNYHIIPMDKETGQLIISKEDFEKLISDAYNEGFMQGKVEGMKNNGNDWLKDYTQTPLNPYPNPSITWTSDPNDWPNKYEVKCQGSSSTTSATQSEKKQN